MSTESANAGTGSGSWWITALFALTSLVGASLLFVVQPMIARLVLPHFGGSATVWSTSSLFFQLLLLVGYIYVHVSSRLLGPRFQPLLHLVLLLLPLAVLPVALPAVGANASESPVLWLLRTLTLTIGLPFAVICTTGPLLQLWYSWTSGRRADDPYFLFATGNLGSFGGLLAYPFLVEPFLTLEQQRLGWSTGFVVFMLLMATCGTTAVAAARRRTLPTTTASNAPLTVLSAKSVWVWLGLAFIPSTLMLGVTAHLSTDVAAVPLLWVVPLAIYLATFVVAFARTARTVSRAWHRATVATAVVAALAAVLGPVLPIWVLIGADLALLFTAAYTAHAELAARRPPAQFLTAFYIVVAAGGALGGVLNGLVAPVAFNWVWEYPIAVVLAAALTILRAGGPWRLLVKRYHPLFARALEFAFILLALRAAYALSTIDLLMTGWGALILLALWSLIGVAVSGRSAAAAVAVASFMLLPIVFSDSVLVRDRSFYGAYTVREDSGVRILAHGTTVHGQQSVGDRAGEPSTYYARSGPVGDTLSVIPAPQNIAVVGLGVGTIAAYGKPGQSLTFFEIDPDIVDIASDPSLFTYISDSSADTQFVLGDGRVQLVEEASGSYDVLFLDAFTSDAIPIHLLTVEAFATYADVLADGGTMLVHVSNRVFNLEPVVSAAADDLGWSVAVGTGSADLETGATQSEWIAMSADPAIIGELLDRGNWRSPEARRVRWTDDFSSVLTVIR
ncbi:spermidine synthase [Ornithinimicrobium cerasi]|uniref:Spermidine synthase n=1 Tax=Ornithinimicrobium cerasi TaxID=2248773 RepID=A0A285VFE8_9MICO|nr:fused MFS/spermidine synthase [Ornithinimicrobium cerasi]SOC51846.1 hypothetical protein SAMN05421879_101329 [Ornithinimicrobium cerasi]